LIVGHAAILLDIPARIADKRCENGLFIRRAASRGPNQHDFQRRLEGLRLRRFGTIRERHGRLKDFYARHAERGAGETRDGGAERYNRCKTPIEVVNSAVIQCHGVIKYHSLPTPRVEPL
jgi:hypothetical protein